MELRLAERAAGMSPSPTLAIDAQAKKMQAEGMDVISFGVGEPDFDTPEHIKRAAIKAIEEGFTKYTAVAGIDSLKEAIVDKLKRDNNLDYSPAQIVVSGGAKHSLYNAIQVLVNPGDEVIVPAPYWVSYVEQVKLAGGINKIIHTKEINDFKLTPQELEAAITPKTKVLMLNSPSNPTGSVYTEEELSALAQVILTHDIYVISDEIYEKLLYDGRTHCSIAAVSPDLLDRTIVINGVSKAYAMTGWRIGYAASNTRIAKAMADLQSHSTSNPVSIAQKASIAALNETQEPLEQMLVEFARRRDYMLERLLAMPGITCNRPGGAFYLYPNVSQFLGRQYEGKTINSADELANLLLEEARIALVSGEAFGTPENLRLSYATSTENIRKGMDRMAEILAKLQ